MVTIELQTTMRRMTLTGRYSLDFVEDFLNELGLQTK